MLNVTMNLYILSFVSIEEAQYADKFWKFYYVILFSVFVQRWEWGKKIVKSWNDKCQSK